MTGFNGARPVGHCHAGGSNPTGFVRYSKSTYEWPTFKFWTPIDVHLQFGVSVPPAAYPNNISAILDPEAYDRIANAGPLNPYSFQVMIWDPVKNCYSASAMRHSGVGRAAIV